MNPAVHRYGYNVRRYALNDGARVFEASLAEGCQVRVHKSEEWEQGEAYSYPRSTLDYIKHALVSWQPSLRFGWLRPQYCQARVRVRVARSESYINVMPVQNGFRGDRIEFAKMNRLLNPRFDADWTETGWLNAQPPTRQELAEAEEEFMQADGARWMMRFRREPDVH